MSATPFAALPARDEIANVLILTLVFALTFGLLYSLASSLSAHVPWRISVALPVDERLPFWPAASAAYLTITPMLLLAPFVLRDLASLLPFFVAVMAETIIGALCFLLLPIDAPPIACCDTQLSAALFNAADTINLDRNYLPSLHVAFAVTAAMAFAPRAPRWGKLLLVAWVVCIVVSTLVTRQHFLVDVIAGAALAWVCYRLGGDWARRADVRTAFDIELLCLRNFARFVLRHRRYLLVVAGVLGAGIPHWRRRRLVRTGFAFLQALDDVLDGDRPSEREPLEIVDELLLSFESGEFAKHDLARLGAAFRSDLLDRGGSEALAIATALMRCMRRDRQRVLAGELLARSELLELHRGTFRASLDLMLLAADSRLRASDVPDLPDAFGWCSTVRDLEEDLAHGLINVPRDVVAAASLEVPGNNHALPSTNAVKRWLDEERIRALGLLASVDAKLSELRGQSGAALLAMFSRSIRRYTR
jgi:membrane-associated phospholipid phosphatase/phytoene/squalene synthetase